MLTTAKNRSFTALLLALNEEFANKYFHLNLTTSVSGHIKVMNRPGEKWTNQKKTKLGKWLSSVMSSYDGLYSKLNVHIWAKRNNSSQFNLIWMTLHVTTTHLFIYLIWWKNVLREKANSWKELIWSLKSFCWPKTFH